MPNFRELAEYCINRYKEYLTSNRSRCKYRDTLYIAIDKDNKLYCSTTTHILDDAEHCLLIHHYEAPEIRNWYDWYKVEYLGKNGEVTDGVLDKGFIININHSGTYRNQVMRLKYNDEILYSCGRPWESNT